jgi:hypothetical protein
MESGHGRHQLLFPLTVGSGQICGMGIKFLYKLGFKPFKMIFIDCPKIFSMER